MITNESPRSREVSSKLVVLALHMQSLPLSKELSSWEPVGVLLEVLRVASQGGPLTIEDAERTRSWSRRWKALGATRRQFYSHHAGLTDAAGAALYHVLQGCPHSIHNHTRGEVYRLWKDWCGSDASVALWPLLH